MRRLMSLLVVAFLLGTALLSWPGLSARAAGTWYVDDDACPGPGTGSSGDPFCLVQDAIDAAAAGDTVVLATGTYPENLTINTAITLDGNGTTNSILDGGGTGRVINIGSVVSVTLTDLTVQNGSAVYGGGIYTIGELTLDNVIVQDNEATSQGGGIFHASSSDELLVIHSQILSNHATGSGATGGGVYSTGIVTINDTTVDGNSAAYEGGGVDVYGSDGDLTLYGAVVSNNSVTENSASGGGVASTLGTVTIYGSTITGNSANGTGGKGGGISTTTDTTITRTFVTDNSADDSGGGIMHWYGDISVVRSVIRGNSVTGTNSAGGGINSSLGTMVLATSEVSGNSADYAGGGVESNAALAMTETTISGNTAPYGGGLVVSSSDPSSIINSTIAENLLPAATGVGGLYAASAVTIKNTIFSGNQNGSCWDIGGTNITSLGNNIEDGNTCGFASIGDQVNTDPFLGPLGDNGGFSWSHVPAAGSKAIDRGNNSGCPSLDQRGIVRPIDGDRNGTVICDVGAVEVQQKTYLPLIMR